MCFLEVLDFMIAKQTWWATPGSKGIVWKLAEAVPTTLHDVMLKFQKPRLNVNRCFQTGMEKGKLARKKKMTPQPDGIEKLKDIGPKKYRYKKASMYQYFPTHWAMVDFLGRNPDAVERLNGEVPLWRPIRIRRERTLVKFTPNILPRTPQENREIHEKAIRGKARNDRRMGYPRPTLPQSGL
jgi:hypothetical protein